MSNVNDILLVEGNPKDSELTLAALAESHLANSITVVRDGPGALDYLHRQGRFSGRAPGNPALVLLDNRMPRMSGIEVLRRIKSDAQFQAIPVVLMVSSPDEPDLVESAELGANAYILKPVDFHQLDRAIREIGMSWGMVSRPA